MDQFLENSTEKLLENGQLRKAERLLKNILASNPNDFDVHFQMARLYRLKKDFGLALQHGLRAFEMNPEEANLCLNIGLIYESAGENVRALQYYKLELLRNPDSGETLFNIGLLYFNLTDWPMATRYLERCFNNGYSFRMEDVVCKLGYCYFRSGNIASYIDIYRDYLCRVPLAGWARANLGSALLLIKDYRGALLNLTRARCLGVRKSVDQKIASAKRHLKVKTETRGQVT